MQTYMTTKTTSGLFESAMRRGFWKRMKARLNKQPVHLQDFDSWRASKPIQDRVDRGFATIPIKQIIGSLGRSSEFDSHFMPLEDTVELRWKHLMKLTMAGVTLPPIKVYHTDEGYFVIDGNHRVSINSFLGVDFVDAHVIRLYGDGTRISEHRCFNV